LPHPFKGVIEINSPPEENSGPEHTDIHQASTPEETKAPEILQRI